MMNYVMLVGRLGRDPEVRRTRKGMAVCSFTLATEEYTKAGKKTDWVPCTAWRETAERLEKMAAKGSLLLVQGRVVTEEWEGKNGKQSRVVVMVKTLRVLSDGRQQKPAAHDQREPGSDYGEEPEAVEITDEDVPF